MSRRDYQKKVSPERKAKAVDNLIDNALASGRTGSQSQSPRLKKQAVYPGYKANRKRLPPPAIIICECPACGWRSQPAKAEEAEIEYVLHCDNVHHGPLDCAFCDPQTVPRSMRFLPTFDTLTSHVHYFHKDICLPDGRTIADIDPMALPPKAFR